jgi:sugar lactone lactonase YvrE
MRIFLSTLVRYAASALALTLMFGATTALQAQNLIVGEYFNRQAIEFSATGVRIGVFATSGGVGRFYGMAFDRAGSLNVTGVQTNNVRRFCPNGAEVGNIIATGLSAPNDIAFDAAGDIYVACGGNSTVQRYSQAGVSKGTFASVPGPESLAFNAEGYLFVTSYSTNSVRRISPTGQNLGAFVTVAQPTGLAFDISGNLYVASAGANTILRFSPAGAAMGTFASTGMNDPRGIGFDDSGNLYVANYGFGTGSTVRRFSPTGADLGNFATGLSAPSDVVFRPAPLPPVRFFGRVALQECRSTPDVPMKVILRPFDCFPAITLDITPDQNGYFSVPDVPRSVYMVSVKGSKWLRQTKWMDTTSGDVSLNFFLYAADANGDNIVESVDLIMLKQAFNTGPGDALWDPRADFNCDGWVDVFDLDLLVRNFKKRGDN